MNDFWAQFATILLIIMLSCVVVAVAGLLLIKRSITRLQIPHTADFFTTLRLVPLPLVVLLDLLDFGLDIFSAPIAWVMLDRLGLPSLRNKAAIEALLPFTGPIPTFTIGWLAVRMLNLGAPEQLHQSQTQIVDSYGYERS